MLHRRTAAKGPCCMAEPAATERVIGGRIELGGEGSRRSMRLREGPERTIRRGRTSLGVLVRDYMRGLGAMGVGAVLFMRQGYLISVFLVFAASHSR